jgi:hypothetical protein
VLCPYCQKEFHFSSSGSFVFNDKMVSEGSWVEDTVGPKTIFSGGRCPSCRGIVVVKLSEVRGEAEKGSVRPEFHPAQFVSLVYPRKHSSRPLAVEVPSQYCADYDEACLVLSDSPKSSAALSRRLLQRLFHEHFGIKKKDLFQEIDEYIATQTPPSDLADQLHAIRNVGNMAVHPLTESAAGTIVDVEPGEAEWLVELIETLLDHTFVRPVRDATRKTSLNAKLAAIGKPPLK